MAASIQPKYAARLNSANPIATAIWDCVNFADPRGPINLVAQQPGSFTGAPPPAFTASNGAGYKSSTGKYPAVTNRGGFIAGDFTVRIGFVATTLAGFTLLYAKGGFGSYTLAELLISMGATGNLDWLGLGGNSGSISVSTGFSTNIYQELVFVRNFNGGGANPTVSFYANGSLSGTVGPNSAYGGQTATALTNSILFGSVNGSGGFVDFQGATLQYQSWKRIVTAQEVASLWADKWQLFAPPAKRSFFGPAAGAAANLMAQACL
jgi:hypothetical protein